MKNNPDTKTRRAITAIKRTWADMDHAQRRLLQIMTEYPTNK